MPCVTALLLLRSLFTTRAFTTQITNEIYPETDTTDGINLFGIESINLPEAIGTNKLPERQIIGSSYTTMHGRFSNLGSAYGTRTRDLCLERAAC